MKAAPFLLLSLFLTAPAMAELYQWKDESGRVHFSDKKPGNSKQINTLQAPAAQRPSGRTAATENSGSSDTSPQERQKRLLHVIQQETDQKEQAKRVAEENRRKKESECQMLREHQSSSEGRRLFYTDKKDESGNLIYLDDTQRAEYDQKIASTLAEKCP